MLWASREGHVCLFIPQCFLRLSLLFLPALLSVLILIVYLSPCSPTSPCLFHFPPLPPPAPKINGRVLNPCVAGKHRSPCKVAKQYSVSNLHFWDLLKKAFYIFLNSRKTLIYKNSKHLGLSRGFAGGSDGKEFAGNAGDVRHEGSILGLERSPGGGHGNPFQYSCLENPMDRGAGQATVHGVTKSWAWLKWLSRQDLDSPANSYNWPTFSLFSPNPATPNLPHSALWFHFVMLLPILQLYYFPIYCISCFYSLPQAT